MYVSRPPPPASHLPLGDASAVCKAGAESGQSRGCVLEELWVMLGSFMLVR